MGLTGQVLVADATVSATGVATGGMQAKLNAAMDAVAGGVGEVRIVKGSEPDIVNRVFAGEEIGTRIVERAHEEPLLNFEAALLR